MNRRKKIKQILNKKDKRANAKKCSINKPFYISKSEREAALKEDVETTTEI
jgi:hypothetical protein